MSNQLVNHLLYNKPDRSTQPIMKKQKLYKYVNNKYDTNFVLQL